jgi:hypothetical protein
LLLRAGSGCGFLQDISLLAGNHSCRFYFLLCGFLSGLTGNHLRNIQLSDQSTSWQVSGRVNRVAVLANLEMQHRFVCTRTAQFRDYLSGFYLLSFLHQNLPIVGVCAQVVLVMIYDNQVSVTQQPITGIHHTSTRRRLHSITGISGNINTFVDFS